jgi:LPXTG-site transpeptidase (sortase) family protein
MGNSFFRFRNLRITHDQLAQKVSKADTGDPVGITGTGRFVLSLNTNATNYPASEVILVDHLPPQLKVMQITSGAWTQELDGTPLFDIVRATVQYSTYVAPDLDTSGEWTTLGVVDYDDNLLYSTLPDNITAVRWVFEHDSDRDSIWVPGLPFDWEFSSSPQIRVTPRDVDTTTTDGATLSYVDAGTLPQTYDNCLIARRRNSLGNLEGGVFPDDCAYEDMTVVGDFVSLRTTKAETPGTSYDIWDDPNIDNFTSDANILPNDTVRYTISVEVTERSSIALDGLTIQDTLPAELIFVRAGDVKFDGSSLPASGTGYDVDASPTFTQVGQVLTWSWNEGTGASPTLYIEPLEYGSHTVTVEFFARVPPGTSPQDYVNTLYTVTDSADVICEVGSTLTDGSDVDGDSNSTETACENTDTYRVERSAALRGEKWIRSIDVENNEIIHNQTFTALPLSTAMPLPADHCPDGGTEGIINIPTNPFTRYPCVSQAYPDGALGPNDYVPPPDRDTYDDFEYNMRIFNEGNVPMLEYVLYDILPYWGDTGSGGVLSNTARLSEFRPVMTGPVQFIQGPGTLDASDFLIEYSFSTNPCRPEVFDEAAGSTVPGGCTDDWTTTVADWSTVRAYRIELVADQIEAAAPAGDELRFGVPMSIPFDAPPTGFDKDDAQAREIAWNSFSHVGSYDKDAAPGVQWQDLLASEPRKVGITIPERLSIGNRVWRDSDNSGTINPPDDTDPGIGGVVVNLYLASDTSTPIATTTTDFASAGVEAGYYLFSNLPPGDYVVGIPVSNFGPGGPLEGLHSSTGAGASPPADYTNPPESNPDSEDHGIDTTTPPTPSTEVFSATITLSLNNEVTGESDLSDDADDGIEGARRGLNAETDNSSDLTVDFGFFGGSDIPYSIGNHVWYDNGAGANLNNGVFDSADENPVVGVRVNLYRDGDDDGVAQADELIRWDETDSSGFYLFDNLDPGPYILEIPASEFADGQPLAGWFSSQVTETDPDTNGDLNDNGLDEEFPRTNGVFSGVVHLEITPSEPTGESYLSLEADPGSPANEGFNPTGWDGPNSRGRFGEEDNTSNLTVDFGFIPPMSLGNRVWIDDGAGEATFRAGYNNGIQDGTEAGRGGVRVELYRDDDGTPGLNINTDTRIERVNTDSSGYYLFDLLQPGDNYYVHIPAWNFNTAGRPLRDYVSSFDANHTTVPADDLEDMDDNGIDDADPSSNGITSSRITMAYGTEPLTPTNETDISSDTVTYGTNNVGLYGQEDANSNLTMDFGFILPPRSLGNFLWYDDNDNGELDGSESNLPSGVRVSLYLDADDNDEPDDLGTLGDRTDDWILFDITDANGYYLFDNLPPRNYIVGVDSGNFTASFDPDGSGTTWSAAPGVLLGYTSSTTTYDNVTNNTDSRDNGVDRLSPENPAVSPHGIISSTIDLSLVSGFPTGETGSGDTSTASGFNPTAGDGPNSRGRYGETDARSDLTIDFGFFKPMSLGNRVFLDDGAGTSANSNNGIMDAGESPIANVRVELYLDDDGTPGLDINNDTRVAWDITDSGGYYLFDRLVEGSYFVHIPAGNFTASYDPTGGAGTAEGALYGLNSSNPTGTENIGVGGNPYTPSMDRDDNGVDDGTPYTNGISSGVVVLSLDNEPASEIELSSDTSVTAGFDPTGSDGPNSRGRYGEDDNDSNLTIDFGFFPVFSVGNRVWFDTNNDSTMGAGEVGVSGVRVQLYNADGTSEILVGADGILDTSDDGAGGMLTDANGHYLFNNLPAGDYTIILPASNFAGSAVLDGYWSSGTSYDSAGALSEATAPDPDTNTDLNDNGMLQSSGTFSGAVTAQPVTLGPTYSEPQSESDVAAGGQGQPDDQANMTVDFGFYTMSLGNLVWLDSDYTGTVTGVEAGIDDVTVELYAVDSSGNPVGGALASVTTGSGSWGAGEYNFTGLPAGDYIVRIPAAEFEGTETLVGYVTSEGASSYYEPAPDADSDTADNDDNGSETGGSTGSGGYVQSKPVTLTPAGEASYDNATGTTNEPRVDFGVFKLSAVTKSMTATSEPDSTGTLVFIGETLTYQIQLNIPAGTTMYSLKAVDVMEAGLAFDDCIDATATNETNVTSTIGDLSLGCPAASADADVTDDGHTATFDFGDLTNGGTSDETLTVQYHVIVLDIAANANGVDDINNAVTWTWTGETRTGQAPPVEVIEPDMDIEKTTDTAVAPLGSTIPFTIEIYQTDISAANAYDVVVTDVLPEGLDYVDGSISAGFPLAWDDFDYDVATRTMTITWDEFPLLDGTERARTEITFDTIFVGPSPVTNEASVAWTSLPLDPQPDGTPVEQSEYNEDSHERWYDPADTTGLDDYGRDSSIEIRVPRLPSTGFAPNRVTQLPEQTTATTYDKLDAMWVEIPALDLTLPIVGVPLNNVGWDLTWLGGQAGYLQGTAYPGLSGNTAITGHVYLPNGAPGPFVSLHTLKWGDTVILHANGQRYLYEVRTRRKVWPNDLSVLNHEAYDWMTLITCQGYDDATDSYDYRIAVRAVLIEVQAE